MIRKAGLFTVVLLAVAGTAFGQDWAKKMFKDSEHDFGTVARSAKSEYKFTFENLYLEDVHIADVHSSCGCTSVSIENPTIKTYEKGSIVAKFNTHLFLGQRGATVTVTIDKPYYAEVQLHVKGNIRSDVVFDPNSVQLGSVDQGTAVDKSVSIAYNGYNGNWKVTGVKSANPNVTADIKESVGQYGRKSFKLNVHLDDKSPAGYLKDNLILTTNDPSMPQIPVLVEGKIESSVSVSPSELFMGVVQPGQKVTKQLVIKSKKPFKIVGISCDDKSFEFKLPNGDASKNLYVIPITFLAGEDMGRVVKNIKIQTDQGQFTPELSAYAVVSK